MESALQIRGEISYMYTQKNVATCILLTIITCGIYGLIWFVSIVDDLNAAAEESADTSGIIVLLLSIVTCNIYALYWFYKAGNKLNKAKTLRGLPTDGNIGVVYLLLSLFGLSIVNYCLIQSDLNNFVK